jgi:hypothetical protein
MWAVTTWDKGFAACIVAVLIMLWLSGCAMSKVPFDTTEKVLVGGMIAGQAWDGASTINGLNRGCTEGNPLIGENPSDATIIGVKVLVAGGLLWIANATDDHLIRKVVLGIGMITGAGAGLYNSTLDCH